jgi:hypothetical protein
MEIIEAKAGNIQVLMPSWDNNPIVYLIEDSTADKHIIVNSLTCVDNQAHSITPHV